MGAYYIEYAALGPKDRAHAKPENNRLLFPVFCKTGTATVMRVISVAQLTCRLFS